MPTPIVSIISKKRTGKTTLIQKLIPELKKRGFKIGTVKHDTHGFDIDHKGKDTWKHKQAGAETVVISSPWKISIIKDVAEEKSLDYIVEKYFSDMDIVLTEGYKNAGKPQVEVFRSTVHKTTMYSKGEDNTLIAVMSDVPVDLDVPRFDINDIGSLSDLIEEKFLKK